MIGRLTPRAYVLAMLGIVAATAGLAVGRPELVALGAPFLVLMAIGLVSAPRAVPSVRVSVERPRVLEGDEIDLVVAISSSAPVPRVEVRLGLSAGLEVVAASRGRIIGRDVIEARAPSEVHATIACSRWGVHRLNRATVFSTDFLGVISTEATVEAVGAIKVLPLDETVRRLLLPLQTQLAYGDLVAKSRGPGIEFSDMHAYQPGDDPRSVNWRASARGRGWWVNDRHPERNSDVVLFIDTLPGARRGVEATLDLAVRAVAGLTRSHLRRNDRVGLVTFGEPVQWLQPGMGAAQRYRILDALMEARGSHQLYWRGISAIPRQALPSQSLIVCVTPLLDDRITAAIADLGGRGLDVAVAEISAEEFVDEPQDREESIARRIWELGRENTRARFARHGIPLVRWDPAEPFERVMEEVERYRRHARRARV